VRRNLRRFLRANLRQSQRIRRELKLPLWVRPYHPLRGIGIKHVEIGPAPLLVTIQDLEVAFLLQFPEPVSASTIAASELRTQLRSL
jgi:hypothetical protein